MINEAIYGKIKNKEWTYVQVIKKKISKYITRNHTENAQNLEPYLQLKSKWFYTLMAIEKEIMSLIV